MAECVGSFENTVQFIKEHQWIFNFQNTNFFEHKVWEKFPPEWLRVVVGLSTEELNYLPFRTEPHPDWPPSLNSFILDAQSFGLSRDPTFSESVQMSISESKGMNPKKRHEVEKLSAFVHSECEKHNCSHIVDVGSGLGYVGQVLSERFGYHVVGLEREEDRARSADKINTKRQNSAIESRTFTLEDNPACYTEFDRLLDEILTQPHSSKNSQTDSNPSLSNHADNKQSETKSKKSKPQDQDNTSCSCNCDSGAQSDKLYKTMDLLSVDCDALCKNCYKIRAEAGSSRVCRASEGRICMMGLHCCADLTPTMLKFFVSRSEKIKSLVCLGCCYHKMSAHDGRWAEFPMSAELGRVLDKLQAHDTFTLYSMRLAAQETRSRWVVQTSDDHEFHTKNVAYRALLELFAKQERITLKKRKRKVAAQCDYREFDTYIKATLQSFSFPGLEEEYIVVKLKELHNQYEQYFKYIELLTVLQVIAQPVLESLILNDRVQYLYEHGFHACAVPLFSQNISPRNLAIVTHRP